MRLIWILNALLFGCLLQLGAGGCANDAPPLLPSEGKGKKVTLVKSDPSLIIEADKHYQNKHNISDFPLHGERAIILVDLYIWTRGHKGNKEQQLALMDLLQSHVPWPFELKRRKNLSPEEKPWGRISVTFHFKVDKLQWRLGVPTEGKLNFKFEIHQRSAPRGFHLNWDGFKKVLKYRRPYEKFDQIDTDLRTLIDLQLPSLVASNKESSKRILKRLDFREELSTGKLHPIRDSAIGTLHEGGCFTGKSENGEDALFRIEHPSAPVMRFTNASKRTIHCTKSGAYIAEMETTRSFKVLFLPWSPQHSSWSTRATFEREVDISSIRFLLGESKVCLLGERERTGERHGKIHCYNRKNGQGEWSWKSQGADLGAVVLQNDEVVVVAGRTLNILGIEDGKQRWFAKIKGSSGEGNGLGCFEDGLLTFSHDPGSYMGFNAAQRRAPWSMETFGGDFMYCDGQGGMYLDQVGDVLLAFDLEKMEPRWRFKHPGEVVDALYHGGYLLLLAPSAIYALNAQNGALEWQLALPVRGVRLIRYDRRIYVVAEHMLYELTRPDRL